MAGSRCKYQQTQGDLAVHITHKIKYTTGSSCTHQGQGGVTHFNPKAIAQCIQNVLG